MSLIITGAHVISPKENIDRKLTIYIKEGKIAALHDSDTDPKTIDKVAELFDATGLTVTPGLIDMHVHLREPGYEYKEDIASGARAAARGGFTSVVCMANTCPVNDNASVTRYIIDKAEKGACVNVFPVGAMTLGLDGKALSEYGDMKEAGAIALSDDGKPVMDALMTRRVMEYAKTFDMLCISHCEDATLAKGGAMNEGFTSTLLGLTGIPAAAEEVMIARDIIIAGLTGARLHIAHVSSAGALEIIKSAKARGVSVTCETAPHYFTLIDSDITDYDTNYKVNPPIRSDADRQTIITGVRDGTIDVIASDHAPHHADEKKVEFINAAFGISGIETMLPLTLKLVREDNLTMNDLVARLSEAPARILGLENKGVIREGADADLTLIDMDKKYTLCADDLRSKGKNSPFLGRELQGRATSVIVGGKKVDW